MPIARQEGIEGRVRFLRDVPFDELVALYNGAIALCHPSLYEGFGNCPSEALAAGCPVVTSNRSSMPEVSGDAALYVDPESVESVAEALRRVEGESGLAESMRAKGFARAMQLTWKAYAEGNLAAYREVLNGGSALAPALRTRRVCTPAVIHEHEHEHEPACFSPHSRGSREPGGLRSDSGSGS